MPRFDPFAALRYAADDVSELEDLIAPPYDVLSDDEVDALQARHEHNIVHVDVPRDRDGPDRYTAAGRRLRSWVADGVLVADETPTFTIYRMDFRDGSGTDRQLSGVVGALEVMGDGGDVLPHERTTPKASTDRLDLTRATEANLSPVWGLSLASGLTDALREPGKTVGEVHVDGVTHTVERIAEPERLAAISAAVASDDVLIADGHHRYGVALQHRDDVRRATDRDDTPAELTMAFVGELVEEQLSVEPIHRLYSGVDATALESALEASFEIVEAGRADASFLDGVRTSPRLALVRADGTAAWLRPQPGVFDDVRALDGLWLEHALASLDHDVRYQHGAELAAASVARGEAVAAVLTRPVTIDEITRTARQRLLMPPKSTFFTPKLRTGFVIRDLTDAR